MFDSKMGSSPQHRVYHNLRFFPCDTSHLALCTRGRHRTGERASACRGPRLGQRRPTRIHRNRVAPNGTPWRDMHREQAERPAADGQPLLDGTGSGGLCRHPEHRPAPQKGDHDRCRAADRLACAECARYLSCLSCLNVECAKSNFHGRLPHPRGCGGSLTGLPYIHGFPVAVIDRRPARRTGPSSPDRGNGTAQRGGRSGRHHVHGLRRRRLDRHTAARHMSDRLEHRPHRNGFGPGSRRPCQLGE